VTGIRASGQHGARARATADVAIEIERKFLLSRQPDWSHPVLATAAVADLTQIYLPAGEGREDRIRRWSDATGVGFRRCQLRTIRPGVREVSEAEISEAEFSALAHLARDLGDGRRPVVKRRWSFRIDNQTFELDAISEPAGRACLIVEIQLRTESEAVVLPDFLPVAREVTGEVRYSNADISRG
jgi:CYTH domain-containing protein